MNSPLDRIRRGIVIMVLWVNGRIQMRQHCFGDFSFHAFTFMPFGMRNLRRHADLTSDRIEHWSGLRVEHVVFSESDLYFASWSWSSVTMISESRLHKSFFLRWTVYIHVYAFVMWRFKCVWTWSELVWSTKRRIGADVTIFGNIRDYVHEWELVMG